MTLNRTIYLLIASICSTYLGTALATSNTSKPEILPNSDTTIIDANHNYTLHCQGNRTLKWTVPEVEERHKNWTKFNIINEEFNNTHYRYKSKLEIFNISYPFVGFYYCHYQNSDTNSANGNARIYVYVNDSIHLTTLDTDYIRPIYGQQFRIAVIPCRPTSPDIQLSLWAADGTEISSKDIRYRYDPFYGFITNATEEINTSIKLLHCSFKRNETLTEQLTFKMTVEELPKPEIIDSSGNKSVGHNLILKCKTHDHKVDFEWVKLNGAIEQKLNNSSELHILNTTVADSGIYYCKITDRHQHTSNNSINIQIFVPKAPQIINTTLQSEKIINLNEQLVLYCIFSGEPKPVQKWYKNDIEFMPSEPNRIHKDDERIIINFTLSKDLGIYECRAENYMGSASKKQIVRFAIKNSRSGTIFILFCLIFTTAIFVFKIKRLRKQQKELKILDLENFEKGALEKINPELCIRDQAELLPYDQKWEFPPERLKLGKQLGSGAFGVVMKAVAKKIVEGEEETTVAVKMVKKNADHVYIKALLSELKIMVHLGKHLNVVNLLGACTKTVVQKELLVIVEYCQFGNLQNFLLKHRNRFIDQIDSKTGKIDFEIGGEFFGSNYSIPCDKSTSQAPLLNYVSLKLDSYNQADYDKDDSIDLDVFPETDNNSVQWKPESNTKLICTKDLLTWAFQVARGMEYLASRRVLHGDLAARNILLAENNVVKICDFGLAKNLYKNDNYKRRGDDPLPVKWMAIESLGDRIFSTQSDVWSFGIVLWEFFSLGKTPYPGMEADEKLYQKLANGYRMESPQFAPSEIYIMMTECWSHRPLARPSFTMLAERLGSLLQDPIRNHYIRLNDPYLMMNTQRFKDGQSDYLELLKSPTFEALYMPHFNHLVEKETLKIDYISIIPNASFDPRDEKDPLVFVNDLTYVNSKKADTTEPLPLPQTTSNSDFEKLLEAPNCVWNSNYFPEKEEEDTEHFDGVNNNFKLKGNYVPVTYCGNIACRGN